MTSENILSVNELHFDYGNTLVLKNINFDVQRGEFLCVLGKSGCGKTTLLHILSGLIKPKKGKIYLEDKDITGAPANERKMGFVFQNLALFENMTVLANIEFALKIKKATRHIARKTSLDLIETFEMQDHIHKKPHQLSGGQRQKVAIARTLATKPEIILFDEPLSSLDVDTRTLMIEIIKQVHADFNCTCIYVTHAQEEAISLANRIMIMQDGQIEQIGLPRDILNNPSSDYVRTFFSNKLHQKAKELAGFLEVNQ